MKKIKLDYNEYIWYIDDKKVWPFRLLYLSLFKIKLKFKKMRKLSKTQFYVLAYFGLAVLFLLFGFTWGMEFPGDELYKTTWGDIRHKFSAVHVIFNAIFIIGSIIMGFWFGMAAYDDEDTPTFKRFYKNDDDSRNTYNTNDDEDKPKKKIKIRYKYWFGFLIGVLIVVGLWKVGKSVYHDSVFLYNTSVQYQSEYNKKVQEKLGFYDKLWKTYLQKEKITNINKETFIEVTKIVMENRADGENITWKWLKENQDIPFEEFSKFYADLSNFITSQRDGYFKIERQCQEIANRNNIMLDTFPNNIYNRWLNREKINFEYGFLSDSTNAVFKSGIENIK